MQLQMFQIKILGGEFLKSLVPGIISKFCINENLRKCKFTKNEFITKNRNLKMDLSVCPATTDSRFLRELSIPVIGFSPMIHTPILVHDHNEYLNEKVFLNGIEVYKKLISGLANEVDD